MKDKLVEICRQFNIEGECSGWKAISNGLINDSFWIEFINKDTTKQYVLQKINLNVFKSPDNVMENIERVTEYMKKNNESKNNKHPSIVFFYTNKKKNYYIDETGSFWRLSKYIRNSIIIDNTDDLNIIREIGRAFGIFQEHLYNYPAEKLHETIKDFHTTTKRYSAFKNAIENANIVRLNESIEAIDYLLSVEDQACKLTELAENNLIPYRVTHNDTKCNNVLLDEDTKKALCVIDLDTVMPGLIMHDFGDAARYICNKTSEDSKDISKVGIDLSKFKAFTEGFIEPIKYMLTSLETEYMAFGVFVMATELAIRFLTDYLNGDKYFKTHYANHNLVRAKCQIALSKNILINLDEMNKIVFENTDSYLMAI
ncbi:MAG TPA: mucin desulfatase [Clostridiales bacterium]|nr:mucin desulfatase [Clostridiales bacterium]